MHCSKVGNTVKDLMEIVKKNFERRIDINEKHVG